MSEIIKGTLSNGIRTIFIPDNSIRTVYTGIWAGSGSRFENDKNNGISHFIEHMLFKGTKKRSSFNIAETMDEIGGQLNAFTTKEYTCFYTKTLSHHTDTALDVLCDMITSPKFSEEDIEMEKGVVCEEIGMYEDSPEDLMIDLLCSGVWEDSMLGANILGTRESVNSLSKDMLCEYMKNRYSSEMMVVAAAGNFDFDLMQKILEEKLGCIQPSNTQYDTEEAKYKQAFMSAKRDFEQVNFCLSLPAISYMDEKKYAFNIFNLIFGGSGSSRLFQRVREQLGLAYSVGSAISAYNKEGLLIIDAAVNPETQEQAMNEMLKLLCEIKNNGVTEKEFARAKEQYKSIAVMALEGAASKAAQTGRSELTEQRIRLEDDIIERIDAVTAEDVNSIAGEFINKNQISVSAVGKNVFSSDEYRDIIASSDI